LSSIAILAFGAVSALGEGTAAVSAGEAGQPARVAIKRDEELARVRLAKPFAARTSLAASDHRAEALLQKALTGCTSELDRVRPAWRRERVGIVLGTSSGGMRLAERAFAAVARGEPAEGDEVSGIAERAPSIIEGPTYFGPMARATRGLGVDLDPAMLVLAACASSSIAIGLASRWLERGSCDVALAGGFDDVTVFVAAGFEALRATTAAPPPRPFRVGRDGMSLGEGAAVLALVRADPRARAYVTGFAAASDAVHLTAPDRNGGGLARAAEAALDEAGRPAVDLVGAHATATGFNDAAESRAIARALGEASARTVVVHPFKAQIGHTLGAAGALETLACLDAIERGVLPAAAGDGVLDPDAPARLLGRTMPGRPRTALKLASAFGGASAALVVSAIAPVPTRTTRPAFVHHAVQVECEPSLEDLAAQLRTTPSRLARTDGLVRLALAAVARLEQTSRFGPLAGGGIVVGTALATLETNALFAARLRELGACAVEPRRFPYTSPNAAPGECSIAFGLTGPSFSVGGGMHAGVEALAAGALLVEAGDASCIVVVAVDEGGPMTRALAGDSCGSGAVALLLSSESRHARARVGEVTLRRGSAVSGPFAPGHRALLPLVRGALPSAIESATPPDAFARVGLHRL
jgi:3-oxoacyl-[acyl-carrier-protein] synthase-1/3-oxoacyl-[acyl-carrier-protein] synthase II